MYRLVESIKVENKQLCHIEWHNKRFNESRNKLFGLNEWIDLNNMVQLPDTLTDGVYKCRMVYAKEIEVIQFQPYTARIVKTLQLVENNIVDYSYKYENRQALARLMERKGTADDILIVKNGCITDTSYANIAFFDGRQWFTPDTYLLNGTQRQCLLAEGILQEVRIIPADLSKYILAKPINAMLDFEQTESVEIYHINNPEFHS